MMEQESEEGKSGGDAEKTGSQEPTSKTSKFDSMSRDELIRLLKKQLITQRDTKRRLEEVERELQQEKDKNKSEKQQSISSDSKAAPSAGDQLLQIELADYRSGLQTARRELQEARKELDQKADLITQISEKLAELSAAKGEQDEELRRLRQDLAKAHSENKEKQVRLEEGDKQSDAVRWQLDECRRELEKAVGEHTRAMETLRRELHESQRSDAAKNGELKTLRADCERLRSELAETRADYAQYKQKAEFILRQNNADNGKGSTTSNQEIPKDAQQKKSEGANLDTASLTRGSSANASALEALRDHLLESVQTRDAQIARLTTRATLLADELRRVQERESALNAEIAGLQEALMEAQTRAANERKQIVQEFEQRLRQQELAHGELVRGARASNDHAFDAVEREKRALALQLERLRDENARLRAELESVSAQGGADGIGILSAEQRAKKLPLLGQHQKAPPPMDFDRPVRSAYPTALVMSSRQHRDSGATASVIGGGEERGGGGGCRTPRTNSESSDDLSGRETDSSGDDLAALVNSLAVGGGVGGGHPIQLVQHSEVKKKSSSHFPPSDDGSAEGDDSGGGGGLLAELSPERFEELTHRLVTCRELLQDAEEENFRLGEQVRLLKDEIRRLEAAAPATAAGGENEMSSSHGVVFQRTEYLKNVVLKFIAPPPMGKDGGGDERSEGKGKTISDIRPQLLPVLRSMLHLSDEELDIVRASCGLASKTDAPRFGGDDEEEADDGGDEKEVGGGGWLDSLFKWQ